MDLSTKKNSFFIYEENTFVREDIEETLALSFPDYPVRVLDAVTDFDKLPSSANEAPIAVLSGDADTLRSICTSAAYLTRSMGVVIIGEAQNTIQDIGLACQYVSRPFNSEAIIDAITDVLSTLQKNLP